MATQPKPIEHDVYVSYLEPDGTELARFVSAALTERRFHVVDERRLTGTLPDEERLKLIEQAPDFVLLLTPGCLDSAQGASARLLEEITHAFKTERNIVPVFAPGFDGQSLAQMQADLPSLLKREPVAFNPDNTTESIARIAHMLASDTTVAERRDLGRAKWLLSAVTVGLVAVFVITTVQLILRMRPRFVEPPPLPPLALLWTGFGQRLEAGRWVEFPVQENTEVLPGDQIRLAFRLNGDGHAYVLSRNLRNEITVLFPFLAIYPKSEVLASLVYDAPVETGWLTVDEADGLRALYIVGSYDPIDNLESMVEERYEDSTHAARLSLLETTIAGLLDGKHSTAGASVRTRRSRLIVQNLEAPLGPATASATLAGGERVTHELTRQPGLVSVIAEIPVRFTVTR